MGSVGDSQKDLISVTVSDSPSSGTINNNNNMEPVFKVKSGNERRLLGALVVALLGRNRASFTVISNNMIISSLCGSCDSFGCCH